MERLWADKVRSMGGNKSEDKATDRNTASTGRRRSIVLGDDHIDSRDLFIGTREIIIDHGSEQYRLRLTAQNKLILTK